MDHCSVLITPSSNPATEDTTLKVDPVRSFAVLVGSSAEMKYSVLNMNKNNPNQPDLPSYYYRNSDKKP